MPIPRPFRSDEEFFTIYSGRRFYLFNPEPHEFDIKDIAHSASQICRFNGHTKQFYSVGEHLLLHARLVAPELRLQTLLSDAEEPYTGDMTNPLKYMPMMQTYRDWCKDTSRKLFEAFAVELPTREQYESIKHFDRVLCCTELRDCMNVNPDTGIGDWARYADVYHVMPLETRIQPVLDCQKVEAEFLAVFNESYREYQQAVADRRVSAMGG